MAEHRAEVAGGIYVVNDACEEEYIPPERLWEWEPDARIDAITVDEFEAQQGERLYDTSD